MDKTSSSIASTQAGRDQGLRESLVARYALPPSEIERRSLALVDAALGERFGDGVERQVAGRMIYAGGDLGLAGAIVVSPGAAAAGVTALRAGAVVVTDVRMVEAGLDGRRLASLGCRVLCAIDDPRVLARAVAAGSTRAVEAMRLLADQMDGAIVAIGNAPTALLSLLDLVHEGVCHPALVVATPVGFTAAAEAKQALLESAAPYITLLGTRGGSPFAAAAVNALLRNATADPEPIAGWAT